MFNSLFGFSSAYLSYAQYGDELLMRVSVSDFDSWLPDMLSFIFFPYCYLVSVDLLMLVKKEAMKKGIVLVIIFVV
jgi:hypothetical protein